MNMLQEISIIYRLQEIDFQLTSAADKKIDLLALVQKAKQHVEQLKILLESQKSFVDAADKMLVDTKVKLETAKEDLKRIEERDRSLYVNNFRRSDSIKTSVMRDKDIVTKRISRLSNEEQQILEENDKLNTTLQTQEKQLLLFENNVQIIQERVEQRIKQIDADHQVYQDKKDEILVVLRQSQTDIAHKYERLLKSKEGFAVSTIVGDHSEDYSCAMCNTRVRNISGEIKKMDKIHQCPQCSRILLFIAHPIKLDTYGDQSSFEYLCSQCEQEIDQNTVSQVQETLTDCTCQNCYRPLVQI
jgi:predicted  nucleic acid-binding Zn-ribbon protein